MKIKTQLKRFHFLNFPEIVIPTTSLNLQKFQLRGFIAKVHIYRSEHLNSPIEVTTLQKAMVFYWWFQFVNRDKPRIVDKLNSHTITAHKQSVFLCNDEIVYATIRPVFVARINKPCHTFSEGWSDAGTVISYNFRRPENTKRNKHTG